MIINNTHVQGIFLYSPDVDYEKGDFVVSGDSIYICTASNPTDTTRNTVSGVDPGTDTTGNYKMYPGDKISTAQEYYDYVNNRLTWNYKNTKEEVEAALEEEPGTLIIRGTVPDRQSLPVINNSEGDVYKVGTESLGYEYAYIPYKIDKYISGNVLNQILQDSFFGVNEEGVITNYVYTNLDDEGNEVLEYSIGGTLANIEDNKILNAIMKSPDLNNGMFNVSRALTEISSYVNRNSTTSSVLVKQYTYLDTSGGNKRIRIQELVDPSQGVVYYRWSEGVSTVSSTYNNDQVYRINDVVMYSGLSWLSMCNNNSGHQPGTDETYWTEYKGDWAYNNITAWECNYSGDSLRLAEQLNDIKAYYSKKIAELEATRKQLTGTFCNREVSGIAGTESTETLVARENVRMHSTWDYIDSDETALLLSLGVSSLSDLFTLVPSSGAVNNYMNPAPLGINIVVKVGTRTSYSYSYSDHGNAWVHGRTLAQVLTDFNVTRLSDIFLVTTETYKSFLQLSPDYPFTVIIKDESSKDLSVSLYQQVQQEWTNGRTLFEESDIKNQVTSVFYEDMMYNGSVLGTAYSGNIGNTLTVESYGESVDIPGTSSHISVPSLYGVYDFSYPTLFRSYFAETLGTEDFTVYDPGTVYGVGDKVEYTYGAGVYSGMTVRYIAVDTIDLGEDPESAPLKWKLWYDYVNGYTWRSSYLGTAINSLDDNLNIPYYYLLESGDKESLWNYLVFGASPFSSDLIYPRGSLVFYDGKFYRSNTEIIHSNIYPNAASGDFSGDWSLIGDADTDLDKVKRLIPDFTKIFPGVSSLGEFSDSIPEGDTGVLNIDSSVFTWLDTPGNPYTSFFAIIYPTFNDTDLFSEITLDNAYYSFFDLTNSVCYLKKVKDGDTEEDRINALDNFMSRVKDHYGDINNSISTSINDISFISGLSGNIHLNTMNIPGSTLFMFLKANYNDEVAKRDDIVFKCRITGGGSSLSYDSLVREEIDHTNITFLDNPILFTTDDTTLGLCTLTVSDLCGLVLTPILKAETAGDPRTNYKYYIGKNPGYRWIELADTRPDIGRITRTTENLYNEWVSGTSYGSGDIVFWNNRLWVSSTSGNLETPSFGAGRWDLYDLEPVQKPGDIYKTSLSCFIWTNGYRGLRNSDRVYILGDTESYVLVYNSGTGEYEKFDNTAFTTLTGSDIFSTVLNSESASLIVDTRKDSLLKSLSPDTILDKVLDADITELKALQTLYPHVTYLVKDGTDYYRVNSGSLNLVSTTISTDSDYLNLIDRISNTSTIQGFSKYYTPFMVLSDISLDPVYTEEFRYTNNQEIPRKTSANWRVSVGPLMKTIIELAGKPDDWSLSGVYNTGDHVIYEDIVWESLVDNNSTAPSYSSADWKRNAILDFISTKELDVLEGYTVPLRTVCTRTIEGTKYYYVNGNYWVHGAPPADDSEYPTDPHYTVNYPWELPDAFGLGKIWAKTTAGRVEDWYVVQNRSGWLEVSAGSYYDSNRLMNATPWWNNSSGFVSAEEALYTVLNTNFVVHPNASSLSDRFLGILWKNDLTYETDDIVIDEDKMWKCLRGNTGNKPQLSPDDWAFYSDPLYNTLTYISSETILLTSIDPSVPFRVLTKIGNSSNYYVALNTNSSDFSDPCIATILVQQIVDNIIRSHVLTIDLSETPLDPSLNYTRYFITENLYLDVTGDNVEKVLTLSDPDARIKNIYYRYKL